MSHCFLVGPGSEIEEGRFATTVCNGTSVEFTIRDDTSVSLSGASLFCAETESVTVTSDPCDCELESWRRCCGDTSLGVKGRAVWTAGTIVPVG